MKYYLAMTLCNKQEIADRIINKLLEEHLVSGSHLSKVHSKYWWNNNLDEEDEFKLEFRTREDKIEKIREEIEKIHDYDLAEISFIELEHLTDEFKKWIDENIE